MIIQRSEQETEMINASMESEAFRQLNIGLGNDIYLYNRPKYYKYVGSHTEDEYHYFEHYSILKKRTELIKVSFATCFKCSKTIHKAPSYFKGSGYTRPLCKDCAMTTPYADFTYNSR